MAMQEADFDHRPFQNNDGDARLYVRFFRHPMQDDGATKKEGRPIFKEVDYIMIQAPGDLLNAINRPARDADKQRFARQWQAYAVGKDQEEALGTPLAHWPGVNRAQVEELAYFKVKTVEQLAGISDGVTQKFMGIQQLKQAAKDWLGRAENSKEIVQLRNTNDEQKQQIEELQAAVRELSQKITQQQSGRGARS